MATDFTSHYHLDKYVATDKPNLRDQYNAAMDKIDDALYTSNTNAADAKTAALAAQQAVSDKASQADLDTLATAVSGKASQADLNTLSALLPSSDFSAQNTIKDMLDNISEKIDEASSVVTYGAKSGANAVNDWQTIFDSCATNGHGIYFPAGEWYFNNAVSFNDACDFVCGDGAIIHFTTAATHWMLNSSVDWHIVKMGGFVFRGHGVAQNAIAIDKPNPGVIYGCHFLDFTGTCISNVKLGLQVFDCFFMAPKWSGGDYTMVGIAGTTDNVIANCKFFGCKTSIITGGIAHIYGCYFYTDCHHTLDTFGIATPTNGTTEGLGVIVSQCEFDTLTHCFYGVFRGLQVCNCSILHDTTIKAGVNSIFAWPATISSEHAYVNVAFDNNVILTPSANTQVEYTIQMFYNFNGSPSFVTNYSSEGCILRVRHGIDDSHRVLLLCGFAGGGYSLDWAHCFMRPLFAGNSIPQGKFARYRLDYERPLAALFIDTTPNVSECMAYYAPYRSSLSGNYTKCMSTPSSGTFQNICIAGIPTAISKVSCEGDACHMVDMRELSGAVESNTIVKYWRELSYTQLS